jgi:hypothetical protein
VLLILFVLVFVLALSLFLRREPYVSLNVMAATSNPYLTLHNFKFNKYLNDKPVKALEGKKASLVTINFIELSDGVKGWRLADNLKSKETLEANSVVANLTSQNLDDFQESVNITDSLLSGGVTIKRGDLEIYTQEAHFLGTSSNLMIGNKPVRAVLKKQSVDAENGFEMDLEKENLELYGPVSGVIYPNEKK